MRKSITFLAVLTGAMILASACGDDGGGEPAACTSMDTYALYGKPFMDTNCVLCHGAVPLSNEIRLDSVEAIRTHTPHIIEHAVELKEPIMPMGGQGLPAADRARLKAWLDCGAP